MKRKTRLALAIGVALTMTAPTDAAVSGNFTAREYADDLTLQLSAGYVAAARHSLRRLHGIGIETIRFGKTDVRIETLIDWLRDANKVSLVIEKLMLPGLAAFVQCDTQHWATHIHAATPAPGELFPTGSAGCEV